MAKILRLTSLLPFGVLSAPVTIRSLFDGEFKEDVSKLHDAWMCPTDRGSTCLTNPLNYGMIPSNRKANDSKGVDRDVVGLGG